MASNSIIDAPRERPGRPLQPRSPCTLRFRPAAWQAGLGTPHGILTKINFQQVAKSEYTKAFGVQSTAEIRGIIDSASKGQFGLLEGP